MKKVAIITGATGFIGGHLVKRFLESAEFEKVITIVRSSKAHPPAERMMSVLSQLNGKPAGWPKKPVVLKGDVTLETCGLDAAMLTELKKLGSRAELFHVAADIRFGEAEREEIFSTNLEGTRNVLNLAEEAGIKRIHHFSTAYIFGDFRKTAGEEDCWVGQEFRNPYEESKFKAEKLVEEYTRRCGFATTVYRPSIVVGDSRTGQALRFFGYYGYMKGFEILRRWVIRNLNHKDGYRKEGIFQDKNGVLHLPIRLWGVPQATVNLVCVDYLVDVIFKLAANPLSIGKTFHVVNPEPPRFGWLLETGLKVLKVSGVRVLDASHLEGQSLKEIKAIVIRTPIIDELEKKVNQLIMSYIDYVEGEPIFTQDNVKAALGYIPKHPLMDESLIIKLLNHAILRRFNGVEVASQQFAAGYH
ncbi:MAG: SDR family oxidoreductase [bacterium]|nr:SDR family oxidoreductase [bacterium]